MEIHKCVRFTYRELAPCAVPWMTRGAGSVRLSSGSLHDARMSTFIVLGPLSGHYHPARRRSVSMPPANNR